MAQHTGILTCFGLAFLKDRRGLRALWHVLCNDPRSTPRGARLTANNTQLAVNNRRRKDIYTLPRADQELLGRLGYKNKLFEVDKAIMANAEFLKKIVANPEIFGQGEVEDNGYSTDTEPEQESDDPFAHQHSHEPGFPISMSVIFPHV